jgi:hypothetical protein
MEHEPRLAERTTTAPRPTGPPGPERMRRAVGDYVQGMHDAYVRQARTLAAADQGRMPLLDGTPLWVAAVGTRHLHVIGTHELLGVGQRGTVATVEGSAGPLTWTLVFYDPVVVPELGLIDERDGPAFEEVRRALGIGTHIYHLTIQPSAGLDAHRAGHTGTGLANAHATEVRELETIERSVGPARAPLAVELAGALRAGLPRAAALVARALAPADDAVEAIAARASAGQPVDPAELRRAVLHAVRPGGSTAGHPGQGAGDPR